MTSKTMGQLMDEGGTARIKGFGKDRNPYKAGTDEYAFWLVGWDAQDDREKRKN